VIRFFSVAFLTVLLTASAAQAVSLTVLGPASILPGARAAAAQFTAQTGIAVTVTGGSRDTVRQALAAGTGDVVLLPTTDFPDLAGVVGMTPLGNVPVGVAVKAGTPVPDISTPEKFRAVLKKAKGVAYADPSAGTSAGKMIAYLLQEPDYAGVKKVPVQGLAVTGLASGQADIALQLLPELANDPAVKLAGPVPTGLGVDFSAGMVAAGMNATEAQRFIAFLTSGEAAALWKANGVHSLANPSAK
jgi:molybdate transport system substrate-binding protein